MIFIGLLQHTEFQYVLKMFLNLKNLGISTGFLSVFVHVITCELGEQDHCDLRGLHRSIPHKCQP